MGDGRMTADLIHSLAGYWCLQCNNAGKGQAHVCAGPVTVAGRRYACSCKENHE